MCLLYATPQQQAHSLLLHTAVSAPSQHAAANRQQNNASHERCRCYIQQPWPVCCLLCRALRLCRYQQVAKATFDVQAKQQYLKLLESAAARLQAVSGAGHETSRAAVVVTAAAQVQTGLQHLQPQGQHQQQTGTVGPRMNQSQQQQQFSQETASTRPLQQPPPPVLLAATTAAGSQGGGSGMLNVLEGTAQEVYRALLFVLFTLEVYLMGMIPVAGELIWCVWLAKVT